jgi:hypothetical protein
VENKTSQPGSLRVDVCGRGLVPILSDHPYAVEVLVNGVIPKAVRYMQRYDTGRAIIERPEPVGPPGRTGLGGIPLPYHPEQSSSSTTHHHPSSSSSTTHHHPSSSTDQTSSMASFNQARNQATRRRRQRRNELTRQLNTLQDSNEYMIATRGPGSWAYIGGVDRDSRRWLQAPGVRIVNPYRHINWESLDTASAIREAQAIIDEYRRGFRGEELEGNRDLGLDRGSFFDRLVLEGVSLEPWRVGEPVDPEDNCLCCCSLLTEVDPSADKVLPVCMGESRLVNINNCGHKFHFTCLRKWALIKFTCPTCRGVYSA